MFNMTLYKREMKGSWKTLLIFGAILTMYVSMIIYMYDPEFSKTLDEFAKAMPQVMSIMGMNGDNTSLLGFMSSYLYGLILIVFPMVFSILCANRLIARYVDRGSMVALLAAPVKRRTVAFTQMKVLGTGIFVLVLYSSVLELICARAQFPGELDITKLLLLNAGLLCLQLFIGGICFLCSCLFDDAKYSVGFGAGIPAFMYVLQMLSNAGESAEGLKYATFFTLFNPDGLIKGESGAVAGILILLAGTIVLFTAAITVFTKKDLHI